MTDPETRCTAGCRPILERRGVVGALWNISHNLGGGGVPGTSPRNISKNGRKWCILRPFQPIECSFPFSEEIHCLPYKRMCEEYTRDLYKLYRSPRVHETDFCLHSGDGARKLFFS